MRMTTHRPRAPEPTGHRSSVSLLQTLTQQVRELFGSLPDPVPSVPSHSKDTVADLDTSGGDRDAVGESHETREGGFDPAGFVLWTLAGLRLFQQGMPTYQTAARESRRILTLLARARYASNITHMAIELGSSRRVVREALREETRGDAGTTDSQVGDGLTVDGWTNEKGPHQW